MAVCTAIEEPDRWSIVTFGIHAGATGSLVSITYPDLVEARGCNRPAMLRALEKVGSL